MDESSTKRMRTARSSRRRAFAVAASMGVIAVALGAPGESLSATRTFVPVADNHVIATQPQTNYGLSPTVYADASPVVRTYLRFNVQGITGTPTRATLELFVRTTASAGIDVRGVANTSWGEQTMTYSNAPAVASTVTASARNVVAERYVSLDVTPLVRGNGLVSMAVTTTSTSAIALRSREAGSSVTPRLTVDTGDGPPPPDGSVVVAAAGDIACHSPARTAGSCVYGLTADAIARDPDVRHVLALGDLQYDCGELVHFNQYYAATWGRFKARTRPVPGNHEYQTVGSSAACHPTATVAAKGYFDYWNGVGAANGPAGARGEGYYSFDAGAWHVVALNSNCSAVGGCGAGSKQERWLRADLAANPAPCTLAYMHAPRFSSGEHGDSSAVSGLWRALHDAGADVVLAGHEHDYERFAPMAPTGTVDRERGIRQFIVGTGGNSLRGFPRVRAGSEVRNSTAFGVLRLTLRPSGYDWEFVRAAGGAFSDRGSGACH